MCVKISRYFIWTYRKRFRSIYAPFTGQICLIEVYLPFVRSWWFWILNKNLFSTNVTNCSTVSINSGIISIIRVKVCLWRDLQESHVILCSIHFFYIKVMTICLSNRPFCLVMMSLRVHSTDTAQFLYVRINKSKVQNCIVFLFYNNNVQCSKKNGIFSNN